MGATALALTPAQTAALAHIRALHGGGPAALIPYVPQIREHARITLNFHPDRIARGGRTVAESLAVDGIYRSQYETDLSNGSRSAHPGGLRDTWEEALFGGAYHADGVVPGDRPKYGALNLMNHSDGAAPRFGSCHVRLRPAVNDRATFCFGDSHVGPAHVGTVDAFGSVLTGLADAAATGSALGVAGMDPAAVLRALPEATPSPLPGRSLDFYIEAQVHGPVDLGRDAEALVLDPSFEGTTTGRLLAATAERCGIAVERHAGFVLEPAAIDPAFRGPVMLPLAELVRDTYAPGRPYDAETLGHAAASVVREPEAWARWGDRDEVLQYIKQLWHCLVRFGEVAQ
ncbi:DUF3626 domain-containing protein [Streptomyces beijiangensis]|uniref:DUF3626 domain-containing protein n=1 Tax=Streptomyces beijiangensis TaxID=163361 RepID=A0A939FAY1_9ACTN|nr:DUF3626 domain-containing protein [Streptomyces beijiangensis]MBO0514122.1 DUF3626 domain-containing protein [Streptomyces beijiangensis]